MKESLLIAYGCIGVATLILFFIYRHKRKGDSWQLVVFAHEFMMLLFAALWPIFLPLLIWSMVRSRHGRRPPA